MPAELNKRRRSKKDFEEYQLDGTPDRDLELKRDRGLFLAHHPSTCVDL